MHALSTVAAGIRRHRAPVECAPPRWRFAPYVNEDPHSVARQNLRKLQGWAPLPYTSCAWTQPHGHVLTAAGQMPVGAAVSTVAGLPVMLAPDWANAQDAVLVRRAILPGALWLLKSAAQEARGVVVGRSPRQFRIVPLPHTRGEVLLLHSSGWHGRGIAWWQGGVLLALVWQVD